MLRSLVIWAAMGAVLVAVPLGLPAAVGAAEIADPQRGHALRGVVLIQGTAEHPGFDHYEVSFAYDPNPTADWFAIEAAGRSAVAGGQLATWDTTQIADGAYQLRLQVFVTAGDAPIEFITPGLTVANFVPLPTASPAPQATAVVTASTAVAAAPVSTPAGTASDLSTSTPAVAASITPADTPAVAPAGNELLPPVSPYLLALGRGALTAIAGFLSLGAYALLRPVVRPAWLRFKRSVSADLRRP